MPDVVLLNIHKLYRELLQIEINITIFDYIHTCIHDFILSQIYRITKKLISFSEKRKRKEWSNIISKY